MAVERNVRRNLYITKDNQNTGQTKPQNLKKDKEIQKTKNRQNQQSLKERQGTEEKPATKNVENI